MARPSRFSPRSEPHEALEQRTVCREELCSSLVRGITDAVRTGQARFDLVLGPRGAGKSHLLGLIEGRLRKELESQALIVGLPEEFHPSSLVHLLAEVLRCLPPDPEAGPVERRLAVLAASPEDARQRAVGMINANLQGQPLVIVVENLDVILTAVGRDGQHQLRSILQTERCWSIVASSRSWSASFSKESEPLFGMFIPRTLEPLSAEGCRTMLVRLARAYGREELAHELDTPKGLARVQTLRHVLGGYPRAMAFIFPHLHHDRPDAVEQALGDLGEELTPYFQEQMTRLPTGQRPVAELLAEHWAPLSVGEIASATFNTQPTVSTYLRRMRDDVIVRSTKLGREHFYEIADPLFRIARAMKRNELRAKTLLRVLQGWYELRGVELWRLPPSTQLEMRRPHLEDNAYSRAITGRLLPKLMARQYRAALDEAAAIDGDHPLLGGIRIVALSHLARDGEAFSELTSGGRAGISDGIAAAAALEMTLARASNARDLLVRAARVSSAGQFAAAVATITGVIAGDDRGSLADAVAVIEGVLRSESAGVRRAATEVVLELGLLFGLAHIGEIVPCQRLLASIEPVGSAALSFNLAGTTLRAWATGSMLDVFRGRGDVYSLARGLDGAAKLGMLLVALDLGLIPHSFDRELSDALAGLGALGDRSLTELTLADQTWLTVIFVLILQGSAEPDVVNEIVTSLVEHPPELRLAVASMVHVGILNWIAVGRDLEPIESGMSLESRLLASVGLEMHIVASSNPDATYLRLAAPERAAVREFARALGLEERHAALCALAADDEP